MKAKPRRDDGATLILVLLVITVLSVILGASLSLGSTNLRASVQLRDQTSDNYAANAAANAAIRQYQNGAFACTSTASPSPATLGTSGSPFYVPVTSTQGSLNAAAQCVPDTVNGTVQIGTGKVTIDTNNTLGYDVLTVGTNAGQIYGSPSSHAAVCMSGGSVVSNQNISLQGQLETGIATSQTACNLNANPGIVVTSAGATGCNGLANDSSASDFTPTPCTHSSTIVPMNGAGGWSTIAGAAPISGYNTATGVNPAPLCATGNGHTYAAFSPGKYTNLSLLNSPCGGADFEWFTPGVYYFDYGTTEWNWPNYVLGGTPQDSGGNVISSLVGFNPGDTSALNMTKLTTGMASVTNWPGACSDPALLNEQGVEFVMGGASYFKPSQHTVNISGTVESTNELCASYSASGIPVVIYGVSKDVVGSSTLSLTGGGTISAETLCASPPCTSVSTDSSNQTMIDFDSNGKNVFVFHGYIYAPSAPINFLIKSSTGVLFGWGLVLRSFTIATNGASPVLPYIAYRPTLHTASTTYYTIRYLNVWTCLASAPQPCATTGTPNVRVKIQDTIDTTTGAILSTKVLSWSEQR